MSVATRAVLLDALGTLVELEPPAARLRAALGGDLPRDEVERAMRAEMAYYREHSHEARDAEPSPSCAGAARSCSPASSAARSRWRR